MAIATFGKLLFSLCAALIANETIANSVAAQEVDLSILCVKFPRNSRCQGSHQTIAPGKIKSHEYRFERKVFCDEFPLNSLCQVDPVEIINYNLEDDEWIRIKKNGNKIQVFHSEKTANRLISLITGEADSLIPLPELLDILPFGILDILPLDLNKYSWQDHQMIQVTFDSDRCKRDSCLITGQDTLELPPNINLYQGSFTVEYQENELLRSVTFKIPDDVKAQTIDTIIISVPEITNN